MKLMDDGILTVKERAFILDKISGTTYYKDEFGHLDKKKEKEIIDSISRKIQLTYYLPPGSKFFRLNHFDFTAEEAKEALEDLERFKKIFEDALRRD